MTLLPLLFLLAADRLSDPSEIVRRLGENDRRAREITRQYTYVRRVEERELDKAGQAKKIESRTFDVLFLYGRRYEKLTAKNDQPLPANEQAKEEEKLRRETEKRQRESENDRQRLAKEQQKRSDELRKMVDEVEKAYLLRLEGTERLDARDVYRISAVPRPGYSKLFPPYSILNKLKGTMWIDADEFQLVKMDAEVIEPFSFGLILARAYPGTHFSFEQSRINNEVWLPKAAEAKIDGRFGLIRKVRTDVSVSWKNFRKFQADSRIVEVVPNR